ncbi:putative esterase [Halanaeroarchaeum sp. HSR-CO]|uniref:alpha/beta hydrolase n=1 Tax=Halanaeroarchaeum sp. HSR-CO TaxID=2866382 RepID=UPI00217DAC11|nr:alpha/beta hydrolase [Halanaeroarchaeum sp. HSR-CO]UWG47530.1 putative esterase [Halanaeroarchaeum sp. HSR-CO]
MAGPHDDRPLVTAGTSLDAASAAMVLVHGRGASGRGIVRSMEPIQREGLAMLAPQAAGNTWYPNSFLVPVEQNEPGRSSGLDAIDRAVTQATAADIEPSRIVLLGFSQGACLASEYVARNPRRYGGLAALSGGLIGETVDEDSFTGSLEGTPVFLGCSDVDPHIPVERVDVTASVFEALDGDVTKEIYAGMGHSVNQAEYDQVEALVDAVMD